MPTIYNKVTANGETLIDLSQDTVTAASHIVSGYVGHLADGTQVTGTGGGGGGTTPASPKQVNFIDYDGTILYSYTAQEANALSALPANPSHSGLTAQGWNWTLQEIKAQLTAMPDGPVWVGQMYITQSGDTEIDVSMPAGRLSPILTIAVNGTVTVDWGDNTAADTVTGSSLSTRQEPSHTYAAPGDYTIVIHVVSGSFTFYGGSSYMLLRKNTNANANRVYSNCIQAIRLGSDITNIRSYAFYLCTSLESITIPNAVTSIEQNAFNGCYSLASVTIPKDVASIQNSLFTGCYTIASISIPANVTSIGNSSFYYCYSLASVTVPNGVTGFNGSAFYYCYSLASITLPSGMTSLGTYEFYCDYSLASITIPSTVTSIGNNAFSYCYSLASVTIPSDVTSIGTSAFSYCYGLAEYHIKPTSPPTLGTTVFNNIVSDCVIYVPYSQDHSVLNAYQTETNWSEYASYMQEEPQS